MFGIVAAGNPTFAQAGTYAAIFAIAAIGLSLLMGNVNQISLGQAGFFGIGAYAVAALTTNWNLPAWLSWPLATLIGIVVATLVGLGLGFIALRFRGHYLAMATLAFGLICVGVFHESKALGGAIGINDIPYPQFGALTISGYPAYWFAWVLALVAALLTLNLLARPVGPRVRSDSQRRTRRRSARRSDAPLQDLRVRVCRRAGRPRRRDLRRVSRHRRARCGQRAALDQLAARWSCSAAAAACRAR